MKRIPISPSTSSICFSQEGYNFEEVLASVRKAKRIAIATYSLPRAGDGPLRLIKDKAGGTFTCEIVTNIPSSAEREVYLATINPLNLPNGVRSFVNFRNHAKIILADRVGYVGSANFSRGSSHNQECGIVIDDQDTVDRCYEEIFVPLRDRSIPFFGKDVESVAIAVEQVASDVEFFSWSSKQGLDDEDIRRFLFTLQAIVDLPRSLEISSRVKQLLGNIDYSLVTMTRQLLSSETIQQHVVKHGREDWVILQEFNNLIEQPGSPSSVDVLAEIAVEREMRALWGWGMAFEPLRHEVDKLYTSLVQVADKIRLELAHA